MKRRKGKKGQGGWNELIAEKEEKKKCGRVCTRFMRMKKKKWSEDRVEKRT